VTEIKEAVLPKDERGNDPNDYRTDTDYPRRVLASTSRVPGSQETNDPELRIVPTALSEPITQISHIIDSILPRGYVTLLGGHGGSGKSLLALILCAHCSTGKKWAGLDVVQNRVLIVSLEDPADLARLRLRRIVAEYGLPADAIEAAITIADGTDGATLAQETTELGTRRLVLTRCYDELLLLADGHGLIIIDNASDAFCANENDRQAVRAFMSALARLARERDAAVLLLAHIDKNAAKYGAAGNSYSGSTAWHNSARSRLALVDNGGGLELRHEKANLCRLIEPVSLTWTPDGVLVPVNGKQADASGKNFEDDAAVLAAIRAAVADGGDVPAARTGTATTQHVLRTYPELPEDLRTAAGRPRFWAAITRLQRAGKIAQAVITTPSRHKKTCWTCAGSSAYSTAKGEK